MLRRKCVLFCVLFFSVARFSSAGENESWHKLSYLNDVSIIRYHDIHNVFYAANDKSLFILDPKISASFISRFNLPGIHDVFLTESDVYIATDNGLYQSDIKLSSLTRIFFSSDQRERSVYSVLEDNGALFIGTGKGVFVRYEDEEHFNKLSIGNNDPIYLIRPDQEYLYFASDSKLFRFKKKDGSLKAVFASSLTSSADEDVVSEEKTGEESSIVRFVKYLGIYSNLVCLVTKDGIVVSANEGENWQKIPSDSLPLNEATSFSVINNSETATAECLSDLSKCLKMIVGSAKGAYFYSGSKWRALFEGMETNHIYDLARTSENLYAATDKGIFYLNPQSLLLPRVNLLASASDHKDIKEKLSHEPTITQVQRWAVDYAEVNPEKILNWRKAVAHKAWLPKLTVGLSQDRNKTIADSIYGTSTGGGSAFIGPNDKSFDDNFGWDASLSWDFGELVWNNDQTSIDSRSKLMVELREDVLDQVTRIYFERRRLQVEMLSAESDNDINQELRIEELTAMLDGFTGGEFSRSGN